MNSRRGLPWLLLAAVLLCAGFVGLGSWQLQRMGWKRDLMARIDARVHTAPQAPPPPAEWPALQADPKAFEYRRLRLQGEYLHASEALVQASTVLGAGHWVLTPLRLADGSVVLVNRGFVPPERRDPARRGDPARGSMAGGTGAADANVTVTGLLRITEPGGGFLRENDPTADRWHSRDVAAIAAARGLPAERVAPYFVDAEATPPGQWPVGGLTVVRLPDNHLPYALTWFTLALMTAGAGVYLVRSARPGGAA